MFIQKTALGFLNPQPLKHESSPMTTRPGLLLICTFKEATLVDQPRTLKIWPIFYSS